MGYQWIEIEPDGPRPECQYIWVFDGEYPSLLPNAGDWMKWERYTHYMETDIIEPPNPTSKTKSEK